MWKWNNLSKKQQQPDVRDASKIIFSANPSYEHNLKGFLKAETGSYDQRAVDSNLLDSFPSIVEDEPIIIYFETNLNTKGVG